MSKLSFALVLVAGMLVGPGPALAYSNLCASVPTSCDYTDDSAPVLRVDVCYSTATGATLKGASACPMDTRSYSVEHGVVEPLSGAVLAFVPLDAPCSTPGICVAPLAGHTPGWEEPICCDDADGPCWPWEGDKCGGTLYFCHDGVTNEDGTVTCFEAEEI